MCNCIGFNNPSAAVAVVGLFSRPLFCNSLTASYGFFMIFLTIAGANFFYARFAQRHVILLRTINFPQSSARARVTFSTTRIESLVVEVDDFDASKKKIYRPISERRNNEKGEIQ